MLVALALYVMVGSILYVLQERFLFRPVPLAQDHEYTFEHEFEELFFETGKNSVINALFFKARQSKGAMLYFHGNAGNLDRWGHVTTYFVDLGYDVLVMDYRTYGKSKGKLSEEALYLDGQKCYEYLLDRYDEKDITVYGRSLGSGIASKIAAQNNPRRVLLESPFYSIADVAKTRFPIFPVGKLLKYRLPNHEHLGRFNGPIAIFHGTEDYVVPYRSGSKLAEKVNNGNVELFAVEGGGHNNLIEFPAYRDAVEAFLK